MEFRAIKASATEVETEALVVNLYQGVERPGGATGAVDRALGGAIAELVADGELTGKLGEVSVVHTHGRIPARRVVVTGLGERAKADLETVRWATGHATRWLLERGITRWHSILHGGAGLAGSDAGTREIAQALAETVVMTGYRYERYKTVEPEAEPGPSRGREKASPEALTVVEADGRKVGAIRRGLERGGVLGAAVNYTRDLANTPPNEMTPAALAEAARELADEHGLEVGTLDTAELEARGMGGILGVGQGSENGPQLIVLRYRGARRKRSKPIAIVGKAITFDSGGVSIKPSLGLEEMKFDKCGGCAVLGVLKAAAELGLKIDLVGIVPAAENMPGGSAYRPSDVLRSYSGKTIEVINTDAEGRLILADGLAFASEQEPREILDLATLTGACAVALGPFASGAFGDRRIVERLHAIGEQNGDRAWPLPLYKEYGETMKSEVADIKNTGGRFGGASNAAAFLQFFVGDGIPWAHIDIAGTAYVAKLRRPYMPIGATGAGVRLVVEYLSSR